VVVAELAALEVAVMVVVLVLVAAILCMVRPAAMRGARATRKSRSALRKSAAVPVGPPWCSDAS
jgi:hypothetical protein